MDADSLICLNSVEKSAFELLRLKNAKKSLSDIFENMEKSVDSAVQDAGEKNFQNSDRIPNSLESVNSSTTALGDLIQIFTSTIKEVNNISEKRKNNLDLKPSDELLIQTEENQAISENSKKSTNEKINDISNRYPELFEIFSEKSGSIEEKKFPEKLQSFNLQNSSAILSSRTENSNSSLNSWRTLKDTPRNDENNFSGASFNSRSICELKVDSKIQKDSKNFPNLGLRRGKKLKTGDQNKMKKNKKVDLSFEKVQGDIKLKSRVLVVKSETKINIDDESKSGKKENKILMDILDILLEVKSNLLSNRKLAESIQERFKNCSVLQSIVSVDAIQSFNEEILRCATNMQNRKNNEALFGVEELLLDSLLRLREAVKEEKHFIKQQEYYYCKFSESEKKNTKPENLRTTIHTLVGNDSSVSATQKEEIEELISYTISLIKKILPDLNNPQEKTRKRNPRRVKIEEDPETQMEIFSGPKEFLDRLNETENKKKVKSNLENKKEKTESKPRIDPTFVKKNPEELKINKKYLSNEKFTRSSTLFINKDSKQTSNQKIKLGNNGKSHSAIQPIWKPAGNAKIPVQPILRQKTYQISSFHKKKERQNEGSTRNHQFSKNISAKESSVRNSKSQIQDSSNFKSDLLKESDPKFLKVHKKRNEQKSKLETRNSNLISQNQKASQKENLISNTQILKTKRKLKEPEAIRMLKEFVKSSSEEENQKIPFISKSSETSEIDEEISVHFLKSKNKMEFSRSSFASSTIINQKNSEKPSKIELKIRSSNDLLKPENKSRTKWNLLQSRSQLEDKKRILKTSSARIPKSESQNSLVKNCNKSKINSARIIDSRSKTIFKNNKVDDKESKNFSLDSSRSKNSALGSKTEFSKKYLRKNPSTSSSYLQSYIKLNSRQNLDSKNSLDSSKQKSEVRRENSERQNLASKNSLELSKQKTELSRENSEYIFDTLSENDAKSEAEKTKIEDKKINMEYKMKFKEKEILETLKSKELINLNLDPEFSFSSEEIKSSESLEKISSSKYCQVSFEPSICSRISDPYSEDWNQVSEKKIVFLDNQNQSSLDSIAKKKNKFVNKHTKSLLILKDILQNHGLDVDLVDEAERKSRSKQKGSKSIYFDKGDGNLLSISSSKTLFDKLASLSESNFQELEIKDINQCSLVSSQLDEEEFSESQKYFQISETSLNSLRGKKPRASVSKYSLFLKKKLDSDQKVGIFPQNFSSRKSEESQTFSVKNAQTETEETILGSRIFTDVEISCNLENFPLSKEASTEISFESFCEAERETKNSEKDKNVDFGINIRGEKNIFNINQNLYEDYCFLREEIIFRNEEMKFRNFEGKSGNDEEEIQNLQEKSENEEKMIQNLQEKFINEERNIQNLQEKSGNEEMKIQSLQENCGNEMKIQNLEGKSGNEMKIHNFEEKSGNEEMRSQSLQEKSINEEKKIKNLQGKSGKEEKIIQDLREKSGNEEMKIQNLQEKSGNKEMKIQSLQENCGNEMKIQTLEEKSGNEMKIHNFEYKSGNEGMRSQSLQEKSRNEEKEIKSLQEKSGNEEKIIQNLQEKSGNEETKIQYLQEKSVNEEMRIHNFEAKSGNGKMKSQILQEKSRNEEKEIKSLQEKSGNEEKMIQNLQEKFGNEKMKIQDLQEIYGNEEMKFKNLQETSGDEMKFQNLEEKSVNEEMRIKNFEVKSGNKMNFQNPKGKSGNEEKEIQNLQEKSLNEEMMIQNFEVKSGNDEMKSQNLEEKSGNEKNFQNLEGKSGNEEKEIQNLQEESKSEEKMIQNLQEKSENEEMKINNRQEKSGNEMEFQNLEGKSGNEEMEIQNLQEKSGNEEMKIKNLQEKSGNGERKIKNLEEKSGNEEKKIQILEKKSGNEETKIQNLQEKSRNEEMKIQYLQEKSENEEMKIEENLQSFQKHFWNEMKIQNFEEKFGNEGMGSRNLKEKSGNGERKIQNLHENFGYEEIKIKNLQEKPGNEEMKIQNLEAKSRNKEMKIQNLQEESRNEINIHSFEVKSRNGEMKSQNLKRKSVNEKKVQNLQEKSGNEEIQIPNLQEKLGNEEKKIPNLREKFGNEEMKIQSFQEKSGNEMELQNLQGKCGNEMKIQNLHEKSRNEMKIQLEQDSEEKDICKMIPDYFSKEMKEEKCRNFENFEILVPSETASQIKLISKLEVPPSFLVFYNKKIQKSYKSKMETKINKPQFSENYKKNFQAKRKFRECKNCRDSLNMSCPLELFTEKHSCSPEIINNNNSKFLVNYEKNPKVVETLKLATKKAKNLYDDVAFCRKNLSPRSNSYREEMKLFEKTEKPEDFLGRKENFISENKLLGLEKYFLEKEGNFLKNFSFKSETLKKTLEDFQEVGEVMIYILENVKQNFEENENETFNLEKRNKEEKLNEFRFGNNLLGLDLFPIVYIIGAIFVLFLFYLLLTI